MRCQQKIWVKNQSIFINWKNTDSDHFKDTELSGPSGIHVPGSKTILMLSLRPMPWGLSGRFLPVKYVLGTVQILSGFENC